MTESVTFNRRPLFDSSDCEYTTLLAPCGWDDFMHQDQVELFMRHEDSDEGLHTTITGFLVAQDRDMSANPSPRRHGMKIHFRCEGCSSEKSVVRHILAIWQHKGTTHVEWEQ